MIIQKYFLNVYSNTKQMATLLKHYLREVLDSSPDCAGEAPAEYTLRFGKVSALSAM